MILSRSHRQTKPVRRSHRPAAPFAAGLVLELEPIELQPNILKPTEEEREAFRGPLGPLYDEHNEPSVLRDRPAAPPLPSSPLPVGADANMTAEELAELEELNRLNPAGAFETDLSKFPAFDRWPRWTEGFYWVEKPNPLLTLPELIDQEARRMRRMETGAGDLMARALEDVARIVRTVDALTPGDVDARLECLERDFSEPIGEPEPELLPSGRWA